MEPIDPIRRKAQIRGDVLREKRELSLEETTELIANAFLSNRYPLSAEGEELRKQVEEAAAIDDIYKRRNALAGIRARLPTVETPHLELFKPLNLESEQDQDMDKIFGYELSTVQVSKGCPNQCDFCAFDSPPLKKNQVMPFAAVLLIGQEKRKFEEKIKDSWMEFLERRKVIAADTKAMEDIYQTLITMYPTESRAGMRQYAEILASNQAVEKLLMEMNLPGSLSPECAYLLSFYLSDLQMDFLRALTSYYDSDMALYVDSGFLHGDGTPANCGDVFEALASELRPMHITTAGWPSKSRTCQKGVEKIVSLCAKNPKLLNGFRISVSRGTRRGQMDIQMYIDNIIKNITTVEALKPIIGFRYEKDGQGIGDKYAQYEESERGLRYFSDLFKQVILLARKKGFKKEKNPILHSSGRARTEQGSNDPKIDAMGLTGIRILPDGTVMRSVLQREQIPVKEGVDGLRILAENSEPEPTGKKIF